MQVGGDQHRQVPLLLEQSGQLAAGGRLAAALQTAEHDHCQAVAADRQRCVDGTHQLDQFLVHDPDDLLAGPNRFQDALTECLFGDPFDKRIGHVEVNVGFEQRLTHLPQPFADVSFGQSRPFDERQSTLQAVCNAFEHGDWKLGDVL